jgi:hypothetical protein
VSAAYVIVAIVIVVIVTAKRQALPLICVFIFGLGGNVAFSGSHSVPVTIAAGAIGATALGLFALLLRRDQRSRECAGEPGE